MNSPVVEVDIRWLNIRHARIDLLFAIQPIRCDIEGIELGRIAMVMRHEVNDQYTWFELTNWGPVHANHHYIVQKFNFKMRLHTNFKIILTRFYMSCHMNTLNTSNIINWCVAHAIFDCHVITHVIQLMLQWIATLVCTCLIKMLRHFACHSHISYLIATLACMPFTHVCRLWFPCHMHVIRISYSITTLSRMPLAYTIAYSIAMPFTHSIFKSYINMYVIHAYYIRLPFVCVVFEMHVTLKCHV